MQINVTLFIQIINFFITYKILSFFLFKPIITSLEEKQAKKDALQNVIKEKTEELVRLEKKKKNAIKQFQEQTKEVYPFIPLSEPQKPIEIAEEKKGSSPEQTKEAIADWLVKKVPDAY